MYFRYFTGVLSFTRTEDLGFDAIALPIITEDYIVYLEKENRTKRTDKKISQLIKAAHLMLLTGNPLFRHLQKRGIHITIWNVNDSETVEKVFNDHFPNFDAIATDTPVKVVPLIKECLQK